MSRIPYAQLSDVQGKLPFFRVGATSVPNSSQIARFLEEVSDELDSSLIREGYRIPVGSMTASSAAQAASQSLSVLRAWAALGAAAKTAEAMPQGVDSKHAEMYRSQFSAILKGISDDSAELFDAERETQQGVHRRLRHGGAAGAGASAFFVKDESLYPVSSD